MLLYVNEKLTVVFSLNFSSRRLIIWKTWCSGRDSKPRFSQRVSDLGEKYYSIYKIIIIVHVFLLLSYSSALSVPVTLRLWSGSPCLCDDVVSHWDVGEFVGCAVGGFWEGSIFLLLFIFFNLMSLCCFSASSSHSSPCCTSTKYLRPSTKQLLLPWLQPRPPAKARGRTDDSGSHHHQHWFLTQVFLHIS